MQTPMKFLLCATALLVANSVFAEEAAVVIAPQAEAKPLLPKETYRFWDGVAFEFGAGLASMPGEELEPSTTTNLASTLAIGHKVGEGALLLRYSQKHQTGILAAVGMLIECANADVCKQFAHYDELGLVYRQRFGIASLGLGAGVVKRTLDFENQTDNTHFTETTKRGAIFYELMLHTTISKSQKMSIGWGIQGQYNKDYPSLGLLVTFQKGI